MYRGRADTRLMLGNSAASAVTPADAGNSAGLFCSHLSLGASSPEAGPTDDPQPRQWGRWDSEHRGG